MIPPPSGYQKRFRRITPKSLQALAPNQHQTVTVPTPSELEQHARRNALLTPWPHIRSICRIIERSTNLIQRVADVAQISFSNGSNLARHAEAIRVDLQSLWKEMLRVRNVI